jgi:plastocyanin
VNFNLRPILSGLIAIGTALSAHGVWAQGVDVSARIDLGPQHSSQTEKHKHADNLSTAVIWLSPVDAATAKAATVVQHGPYRLVQKDKQFIPHLLVVPTGSSVDFPNLDPFFHNVFSLYNGKRFDLGLYEAGANRSVRFDREGVSYIFCNIHPEMGAVVLSLSTPYYALTGADGVVMIHGVPPGSYRLLVWSEHAEASSLTAAERVVHVASGSLQLGTIQLHQAVNPMANHKNKFGEDYPPTPPTKY